MVKDRNELMEKILQAADAGEIMKLFGAEGEEITEEQADRLFEKAQKHKENQELSLDELETVSGGADRDWLTDGCAATVEAGSWCGSNDSCAIWEVTYDNEPVRFKCDKCLTNYYIQEEHGYTRIYKCPNCGYTYEYFDYKGNG